MHAMRNPRRHQRRQRRLPDVRASTVLAELPVRRLRRARPGTDHPATTASPATVAGQRFPTPDTISTATGSTICDECRDNWFWRCPGCDEWNPDGGGCANDCCDPDDCDCDDCRDDDSRGGLVHDYEYKPWPVFHGTGPLFLGPEIEIETPHSGDWECAEMADSHLGSLGYLKNDSSINSGFEIVTHPMSYQWAMDNFPWQMLTELRRRGCHASEATGIHVHVSRAGFAGASHTYRWMKFIYRNERQVTTLARRSSPEYAAFTDDDRRAVKDYAKGAVGQRCRAINTGNDDTFELRIFASSLDPDEVKAALGFAAASVEYTGTSPSGRSPTAPAGPGRRSWRGSTSSRRTRR